MICGIVAEYNPFHNGHLYQLQYVRQEQKADHIIIVMSGDYVQRGVPALIDKMTRTRMALLSGADLVLELPVSISCASAEEFAYGAVSLLDQLGCVDTLCFGAETDQLPLLSRISKVFAAEPEAYQTSLRSYLRSGYHFAAARSHALMDFSPELSAIPELPDLLASPNNILALEYLKALQLLHSDITPELLLRSGNHYHDAQLLPKSLPSATSIRQAFLDRTLTEDYVPHKTYELLMDCLRASRYVLPEDFSDLLFYRILEGSALDKLSPILANRIRASYKEYRGFSDFTRRLKTKEMTQTAISRALLQMVLLFTPRQKTPCPYARILGFRREHSSLLRTIKDSAAIPLLSRMSETPLSDEKSAEMFQETVFASNLYEGILSAKSGEKFLHDYEKKIVIL